MIKHIVLWKLKDAVDGQPKKELAAQMKALLEGLRSTIPQIQALEVGLNFNPADTACDISLYTEFLNQADLEAYQNHPEHQKVVDFVRGIVLERRISDYEI